MTASDGNPDAVSTTAQVVRKCEGALTRPSAEENGKQFLTIVRRAHIESTNLLPSVLQACKKETTYTSKAVDANSGLDHLTHQGSLGNSNDATPIICFLLQEQKKLRAVRL
ncbi:hypothetical protein Tco_0520471 [Tanacetum coccineum]